MEKTKKEKNKNKEKKEFDWDLFWLTMVFIPFILGILSWFLK